jgi:molybdenum cofactor cytidylyltransferase
VGLVLTGSASSAARLKTSFERPLRTRVNEYGSNLELIGVLPLEDEPHEAALAEIFSRAISTGFELILLAGETAIMDRRDIIPRAIERAGGTVECVGLPVDPGNMLMLANLGDMPILGAPGCARSLKTNAIDWVLTRLLAGERLTAANLLEMGYGGLLEDTSKRPMPRSGQNSK